jgi:DNA mismatch endonuclease, patch repair protein
MVDHVSKDKRSKIMAAIHSKNTTPELTIRSALWRKGYRFRIHYGSEKIDVAFPSKKIAIFVDGCFWHNCPLHSHIPKSNEDYWIPKLKKNKQRDAEKNFRLTSSGWKVLHFWEHEMADISLILKKVEKAMKNNNLILQ